MCCNGINMRESPAAANSQPCLQDMPPNMAFDLAPFSSLDVANEAAQRRSVPPEVERPL
jgi:hypothetical protein